MSGYNPASSSIVVDANSGTVMHASNPDALRHPASLTKIMTLYMLFEQLDSGKLKLDSMLNVSEHAAEQPPTKLGLRDGQTIRVEDAIKGMVTRSANDAAVVVSENLAESEEDFAAMMTRKARALGMKRTVYRNASGLPDDEQVTTARDQAILGRAIQERFPRYYKYFSIRSFEFRGQTIGNHNRLLGRVDGVDGIKTGYIRSAGFNLVTSVRRGNRHIVAVVLGGSSAGSRDARMRGLISEYIDDASTKRTAPMIAEARPEPKGEAARPVVVADAQPKSSFTLASASSAPVRLDPPAAGQPSPGSTDPIRPVMVKTLNVKPGTITTANTASLVALRFAGLPRTAEPAPAENSASAAMARAVAPSPSAAPAVSHIAAVAPEPRPSQQPQQSHPVVRKGWMIQVGAYPEEDNAKQQLSSVKSKASRLLKSADPFTESVQKGDTTLYRARFAGLEKDEAEAACKFLKRNDVECMAIKN